MARTNIDIDEALIAEVMRRFHLRTKREAVDFALRRAAGSTAIALRHHVTLWHCDEDYARIAAVTDLRQRDLR